MAPEQAGGRSKDVGPAADVYALGRDPLRDAHRPAAVQGRDAPGHARPGRPRRAGRAPAAPAEGARATWRTICLKCLNKEPARRYPSAPGAGRGPRPLPGRASRSAPARSACSAGPRGGRGGGRAWPRCWPSPRRAPCSPSALVTWEGRRARLAQASAEQAGREEQRQRIAAEEARGREAAQRRSYQGLSARLLRDQALRHCEQGDVGRGLLWLAQSLRLVPEDDLALQRAIRTNLAGWRGQTHPLQALLGHADRVLSAVWSPDGRPHPHRQRGQDRPALGRRDRRAPRPAAASTPDPLSARRLQPRRRHDLDRCRARGPALERRPRANPPSRNLSTWDAAASSSPHAFSPDGDRLWTVVRRGPDGLAPVLADEHASRRGQLPSSSARGVALATFSPDGRSLVTAGSRPGSAAPACGRPTPRHRSGTLTEHTQRISSVAFNPKDGRTFVTGSLDRTCRLWDAATGDAAARTVAASGAGPRGGLQPQRPDHPGGGERRDRAVLGRRPRDSRSTR